MYMNASIKIKPVIKPKSCSSIFVLRSPQTEYTYYGSTKVSLSRVLNQYRSLYLSWKTGKGKNIPYRTSFEIIYDDDCSIELIEAYMHSSDRELKRRVMEHIKADDNSVNRKMITNADRQAMNEAAYLAMHS